MTSWHPPCAVWQSAAPNSTRAIGWSGWISRHPGLPRWHLQNSRVPLDRGDAVILAVTPDSAHQLLPELVVPRAASAIITVHYVLRETLAQDPMITGLIDTRPLWLLTRGDLASVTVGAADDLLGVDNAALARLMWRPVATALQRDPEVVPPHRVLRFRHGTFAHTPLGNASRPATRNGWTNLFLAGDWIRTGQAATSRRSGAIRPRGSRCRSWGSVRSPARVPRRRKLRRVSRGIAPSCPLAPPLECRDFPHWFRRRLVGAPISRSKTAGRMARQTTTKPLRTVSLLRRAATAAV